MLWLSSDSGLRDERKRPRNLGKSAQLRWRMLGQSLSEKRTAERRFAETLASLNILQLVLIHAEIVSQFMDDRQADLFADFGLVGADRFDVLLIKHDVIRPRR